MISNRVHGLFIALAGTNEVNEKFSLAICLPNASAWFWDAENPRINEHSHSEINVSPELTVALEQVRRFAAMLPSPAPDDRRLLDRAFSENLDQASTAIPRLAPAHDPALAAIAWSYFWIRQGELFQARNELETVLDFHKSKSFWSGIAVQILGEICLELGDVKKGSAMLRRARKILGEPS